MTTAPRKPGPGRPPGKKATEQISISATPEQLEAINRKAEQAQMTRARYMREAALSIEEPWKMRK